MPCRTGAPAFAGCRHRTPTVLLAAAGLLAALLPPPVAPANAAAGPPPIRTTPANQVPACATPARLMAYIKARNGALEPKFEGITEHYRRYGELWKVRWDYAVFQMILETNYLKYRRANGQRGDVHPRQNNFAGLGATGGGVPGDRYPDVATGVRAQIEHLVAYSGERVPDPVGARTRLKQGDIVSASLKLRRPVTFADLRKRWAADPNYSRSIEGVAARFRDEFCAPETRPDVTETAALPPAGQNAPAADLRTRPPAPTRASRTAPPQRLAFVAPLPSTGPGVSRAGRGLTPAGPTVPPAGESTAPIAGAAAPRVPTARAGAPSPGRQPACHIMTASFGGRRTVLIRSSHGADTHYTLLTVLAGFERSLVDSYTARHAPGGDVLGTYDDRDAALARAQSLCR